MSVVRETAHPRCSWTGSAAMRGYDDDLRFIRHSQVLYS